MKKSLFLIIPVLIISFTLYYFNYIRTVGEGTIPVITYHSIMEREDKSNDYVVSKASFERMIETLKKNNFTFLSLRDVEDIIYNEKELPENPVLITLDDGYEDNYKVMYPVIKENDAKVNIFLIGSLLDTEGFLKSEQIAEMSLSGFVEFGSHSFNMHGEFESGKDKGKTWLVAKLEDETDEEYFQKIKNDLIWNNNFIYERSSLFPSAIAYPGAMVNDAVIEAAKEAGLKIGFVGANKFASKAGDLNPYKIKRFNIKESTDIDNMVRFLKSNNKKSK
ncbi:putative polysaccharide deacetylase family protein [Peptoniphilus sp. ING2-D1G]|nr:putative polysaccharide deacetylase family protein [Peptoniphilus sp. ING2-D1G]